MRCIRDERTGRPALEFWAVSADLGQGLCFSPPVDFAENYSRDLCLPLRHFLLPLRPLSLSFVLERLACRTSVSAHTTANMQQQIRHLLLGSVEVLPNTGSPPDQVLHPLEIVRHGRFLPFAVLGEEDHPARPRTLGRFLGIWNGNL
jgi:hypothetical protein